MADIIQNFPNCGSFTIYTEDFQLHFGNCQNKDIECKKNENTNFTKFFDWLADKSPEKKPFFEF